MKKVYTLLIAAVAVLGTAFLLPKSGELTFAEENTQGVNVDVPVVLSAYSTKPTIELDASPNTFKSDTADIIAATNSEWGYSVTIGSSTTNNALSHKTASDNIPSLGSSETGTSSNFPTGKWGLSIGNTGTFSMVPTSTAQGTLGTTEEPGSETYTIAVGAKPGSDAVSGTYSNILLISMIANAAPTYTVSYSCNGGTGSVSPQTKIENQDLTLSDGSTCSKSGFNLIGWDTNSSATTPTYEPSGTYSANADIALFAIWKSAAPTTMQEMTPEYCASMAASATMTLKDARDNNEYTIVKLGSPINACWMQENLRLGNSTDTYDLDSTNSDLPSGTTFTLQPAQTSGTDSWSCSSDDACKTSRVYVASTAEHPEYGNYYSWYTATANTGTYSMSTRYSQASGSICPKGWRLPEGYTTAGGDGEFKVLNNTYNSGSTSSDSGLLADPLKLVRAGNYNSGVDYQGSRGLYWSSTVLSSTPAYNLYFGSSYVYPAHSRTKYLGFSLRCLSAS